MRTKGLKYLLLLAAVFSWNLPKVGAGADSKCAEHYAVVEPSQGLDEFLDSFDSKFGTSDAEEVFVGGQRVALDRSKIAGVYGCQFKGTHPPENACPSGTAMTRGMDVRYICHSNEPIPEGARTCAAGYAKIQDYEYEKSPAGKIGRFGLICNAESDDGQDGFNEDACRDGATLLNFVHYAAGNPYPMVCCVHLK